MKYKWFTGFLIFLMLTACSLPDTSKDTIAEEMAVGYITAIKEGDYEKAFSYCSDEFFQQRDEKAWADYFKHVKSQLGELKKVKIKRKLIDERLTGRFFMFQFANKYENGLSTEMITLIMKDEANGEVKLFGHKIDSSKLN